MSKLRTSPITKPPIIGISELSMQLRGDPETDPDVEGDSVRKEQMAPRRTRESKVAALTHGLSLDFGKFEQTQTNDPATAGKQDQE